MSLNFFKVMVTLGLVGLSPTVLGQSADCANPRKADGAMSETYYRGVEQAMDLMSKSKNQEAIDRLSKMVDGGSEYEKAIIYYNLGFAYSSKNDYGNAAKNFEKALALNAMPQQQYDQLMFNLGQLYVADKQYDAGIRTLERYIAESCTPVTADTHIFLAQAYLEQKRFKDALPQVDLAIAKSKQVKESWLQLKLAINYELKNYRACADVLLKLITMVPAKADYWKQLSGMFSELKDDAGAVAVLSLADRQGFLTTPNEIRNLYNIYMMVDLPYKAGNFLQDAIDKNRVPGDEKNLNSVADAWINARESAKAEVVLKKLAATSDKGEYYFKLGAMYGDDERWKESREMLEKAVAKGSLGNKAGETYLRLAVADYSLKDYKNAEAAANKALGYDNVRNQASQWLRQIRMDANGGGAAAAAAEPAG
ncbi:MAG: Tetratricopeptide repeat-containing protein [Hydrocarboniphaga sp.]|uniref:tetratricopeptide repeat protein n=1 Tax=Hydrocarboniphaga sp. TaxID=2033016 RepID=UPI002607F3B6|nr:tetratricopeptide repeat protein [Hydrocarboniphaga sp.]MDB5973179.1 Tetratricopeptide repeat-containing protein [Hydrocarboniphaga sp.]